MVRLIVALVLLLALNACTPRGFSPADRSLSRYLKKELEQSSVLKGHLVGLVVFDKASGKTIFSHQGNRYFIPASTTKLFTLYAGLCSLGDSLPGIRYRIQGDSLLFAGTGDPSLLHPDLPQSAALDFLKSRSEQLVLYEPDFARDRFGAGWAWDDYNDYYQTERTVLPVYGNFVRFRMDSVRGLYSEPGVWADSMRLNPLIGGIRREEFRNLFNYSRYPLPAGLLQDIPMRMSPELTAQLISRRLGKPVGYRKQPFQGSFSLINSIPADSLYARMMQVSDNMLAEQLMLLYAFVNHLPLNTEEAIRHMIEKNLSDLPDRPLWRDGSGLSRYNLFTPGSQVALLSKIEDKIAWGRIQALFAKGGSGTLRNGPPYLVAKTGSLSNNYNLSGYLVTRRGRRLTFSFMNNNFAGSSAAVRKEVERILKGIHDRY